MASGLIFFFFTLWGGGGGLRQKTRPEPTILALRSDGDYSIA